MHRTLTAIPVGQRFTTAMGAVIAVLACAVALPAGAQAATVAWSTKKPRTVNCSTPRSVSTSNGQANIKDCLVVSRSTSGTYYYQGVLEVRGNRGDLLGGKSMIARANVPLALGVNDCPRQRWSGRETRWCYSPTKSLPPGQVIYGKGVLLDPAQRWYPVWSKTLKTYRNQPSPTCVPAKYQTKYLGNRPRFHPDFSIVRLSWQPTLCKDQSGQYSTKDPTLEQIGPYSGVGLNLRAPQQNSQRVIYRGDIRDCVPYSAGYAGISFSGQACSTVGRAQITVSARGGKVQVKYEAWRLKRGSWPYGKWVWTDKPI
jgi:hypothetical protein